MSLKNVLLWQWSSALTRKENSDSAVSELPEQTRISCRITIHNHQLPVLPTGSVTGVNSNVEHMIFRVCWLSIRYT